MYQHKIRLRKSTQSFLSFLGRTKQHSDEGHYMVPRDKNSMAKGCGDSELPAGVETP